MTPIGWAKLILGVLLLVGVYAWGHSNGADGVQADFDAHIAADTAATLKATQAARAHEQADAKKLAQVAEQYEQDKADALAIAERTVADLRAGTVKLRDRWQGCQATARVSGAATSAAIADADAQDRAESAGRIIRAAAEADAQIRGLQDVLRAERR